MLIDTHCHLDFPAFDGWRDEALAAARAAGVQRIVVPAITVDNFERVLDLCAARPGLYPALGLHPCFTHAPDVALEQLSVRLQRQRLIAVGEIGLDFRPDQAVAEVQIPLLEAQLELAKRHELPVLLHAVHSHDQVLKLLRRLKLSRGGIVHAFSGSEQQAHEFAKLGFKLGFGGAISYRRATRLRRLAAQLPLEWLVLETDAPDMPLAGWREEPNRPQRVAEVARIIAHLRGIDLAEVARTTSATASAVLRLPE